MIITSRNNELIKNVRALKQKKQRDLQKCYIVEGEKSVLDAFATGQSVKHLFVTEKQSEIFSKFSCTMVSESVMQSLTDEVTPQGVLAVVEMPEAVPNPLLGNCLLLDRVQDPGNVGTILRTAVACGVKDVFLIDCADAYSPKTVRSSMGGIFRVNLVKIGEAEAIDLFKQRGITLLCADMDGENVFEFCTPEKFCLCVGNEGQGISENLKLSANKKISIPMQGGMESLNVAVATSVALYTLLNNIKGV